MCYGKFSEIHFLTKEYEIRLICGYQNEGANYLDFISLFMKVIRSNFCDEIHKIKGYQSDKIVSSTIYFLREMEILVYEFSKLALSDCYLKRYLHSYVSGSIIILSFELLLEKVDQTMKLDLKHICLIHEIIQTLFSRYFGYNKYVFLQTLGKFIWQRF